MGHFRRQVSKVRSRLVTFLDIRIGKWVWSAGSVSHTTSPTWPQPYDTASLQFSAMSQGLLKHLQGRRARSVVTVGAKPA